MTTTTSPSSLAQSSSGRFEVTMVEAFSWRLMTTSASSSPAWAGGFAEEQVVDDQQLCPLGLSAHLADFAQFTRFGEVLDQLMRLAVQNLVAALHRHERQGLGCVALAGARRAI